jgi:hypothetical protein
MRWKLRDSLSPMCCLRRLMRSLASFQLKSTQISLLNRRPFWSCSCVDSWDGPVAEVAGYASEFLTNSFSHYTSEGKWLGYALDEARISGIWEQEYRGCLLLLPDSMARVSAAAAIKRVNHDHYGAGGGGSYFASHTGLIAAVGHDFGTSRNYGVAQ